MGIHITKNENGNLIRKSYNNYDDMKIDKWISYSNCTIGNINFDKSYSSELYCRKICGNCYAFGTNCDIRCNKNDKPIQNVVSDCPKFQNAKKLNDKIIEKMLSDDTFFEFCKFYNEKKKIGKFGYTESLFEIFLGIFNENRFSENRNELKFKNR